MREYPVFLDKKGNRFIFPGLYVSEEISYNWSYCRYLCSVLGVTEEKGRFDGSGNFEYVVSEAGSSGFAHGSEEVYLIGGPIFDEIKAETANA